MNEIAPGYCQCGCGGKTPISRRTYAAKKYIKGQPRRFIPGHHTRGNYGLLNNNWHGGKRKSGNGYVLILMPNHPRAHKNGCIFEHIAVCERALGKVLPQGAIPHHVDGDRSNNEPSNLVVCQNNAYHRLLHQRERASKACGHANWRKCHYCKKYDDPFNLTISGKTIYHKSCDYNYKQSRKGAAH